MSEYPSVEFIDHPSALDEFCCHLSESRWIAVDTEFMRERTYHPALCLVQIYSGSRIACIDPIALPGLAPLRPLFQSEQIIKVFHSGRQDLEVLNLIWGELPVNIFDTQVASQLMGFPDQVGYARLVEELTGVLLDKDHTRTDWSQRPLTSEQIRYAADDVYYLGEIFPVLAEQLRQAGRRHWAIEDSQALLNPDLYRYHPEQAWKRVKGSQSLVPDALPNLQRLAAWRENRAIRQNLPRNWIIKDSVLCELAQIPPEKAESIHRVQGLNQKSLKRYGPELISLLKTPLVEAGELSFARHPCNGPDPDQKALYRALSQTVRRRAEELGLHPVALASRKELESLVESPGTARLLQGWRKGVIGESLVGLVTRMESPDHEPESISG